MGEGQGQLCIQCVIATAVATSCGSQGVCTAYPLYSWGCVGTNNGSGLCPGMDGLAVLQELSGLHNRMMEYISLSPLWIGVDDCANSGGPCSCLHELLMLLINTVGT